MAKPKAPKSAGPSFAPDGAEHFDHAAFLKHASQRPGVYRMLDTEGETLYVGKAKNLRARLSHAGLDTASGLLL